MLVKGQALALSRHVRRHSKDLVVLHKRRRLRSFIEDMGAFLKACMSGMKRPATSSYPILDKDIQKSIPEEVLYDFFQPHRSIAEHEKSNNVINFFALPEAVIIDILRSSLPLINIDILAPRDKRRAPHSAGYAIWKNLTWLITFASPYITVGMTHILDSRHLAQQG